MKPLDKIIIKITCVIIFMLLVYGLVYHKSIVGYVMLGVYMVYLIANIVLLYPTFVIGVFLSIYFNPLYEKINKTSSIIAETSRGIVVFGGIILVNIIWLYAAGTLISEEIGFFDNVGYSLTILNGE